MDALNEIPEPLLTRAAVGSSGDQHGDVPSVDSANAALAAPIQRNRPVRWRWALWVILAVMLGCAAYGFSYINRPAVAYRRALKALGQDDFDTARYELLRLEGLPEFEPHASLLNGILLLQEQKPDDALDEFRLAVDHPDTQVLALTLAGRTLLQKRQFFDAERALLTALELDPNMAEAHGCLGAAYFDAGDFGRSEAHLARSAELLPNDPRPYRFMATIHQKYFQYDLAIHDLREMLRRGTANPFYMPPSARQEALLDLAQIQTLTLRHKEAIDTLKDTDESPDSLALLAQCQFALGNLGAARDCVARVLALDPDHFDALLMQGRLAMEGKDATGAIEILKRASALRPKSQALHVLFSQALYVLNQDDLAKQHAEKASQLRELEQEYTELRLDAAREPGNSNTCFRLGLMAERLGMEDDAAGWYRAAILLDPQHAKAREQLSQIRGGQANLGGP